MDVQELRPGLWRWTAPHPDWTPEEAENGGWDELVASHFLESPEAIVLIDPLVPADEAARFWAALDRDVERTGLPVVVVITIVWHERSAAAVAARYGAELWASEETAAKLELAVDRRFRPGERLPGGIETGSTLRGDEVWLWLPAHRALVVADVVLGSPLRVCPDEWVHPPRTPAQIRENLRGLLELPIELILTAHGEPVLADGRAALERALG